MTMRLSPENQALVDYIRANQPMTALAIYAFHQGDDGSYKVFRKRLVYLKSADWLSCTGSGAASLWSVNPNAPTSDLTLAQRQQRAIEAAGPVVPPRQHNVMAAVVYEPKPAVHRSGAMDYAAIPSHICGEIRPFKGGM